MTSTACSNERVTVKVELAGTDPRSIFVIVKEKGVSLPCKLISYDEDARIGELVDVTMPKWLAEKEGVA